MTRTRLALLIVGIAGVLVIAGLVAAARSRPGDAPVAAAPADSARPLSSPAAATERSRTPAPDRAAPPIPELTATPGGGAEPFVQTFANQPGVPPLPKLPSPTATHRVPAFADGCDHAYGDPTQCVPMTFPSGTTDKCAWLAAHGLTEVTVVGPDRQKLDPDGDKIACSE